MAEVFDFDFILDLELKKTGNVSQLTPGNFAFVTDAYQLKTPTQAAAEDALNLCPHAFPAPTLKERLELFKGQWLYEKRILKTYFLDGKALEYTWTELVGNQLVWRPIFEPHPWLTDTD